MQVPIQGCNGGACVAPPVARRSHTITLGASMQHCGLLRMHGGMMGGLAMLNDLVALMEEAAVAPTYTQHLSPQGHPRSDPNDSTASAIAQEPRAPILSPHDNRRGESNDPTASAIAQEPGAPILSPHHSRRGESNDPTSSATAQGHAAPACAQIRGSSAMLTPWRVLSPQGHPRGDPNDSAASSIAQGHGAPACIESTTGPVVLSPRGVLSAQCETPAPSLDPPPVVDSACITPTSGDGVRGAGGWEYTYTHRNQHN